MSTCIFPREPSVDRWGTHDVLAIIEPTNCLANNEVLSSTWGPKGVGFQRTEISTGSEGPSTDSHWSNKKCGSNFSHLIVDFFQLKKMQHTMEYSKSSAKTNTPRKQYCAHNSFWASWVVSERDDYGCSFKGSSTYSQTSIRAYTAMWFLTRVTWPLVASLNFFKFKWGYNSTCLIG